MAIEQIPLSIDAAQAFTTQLGDVRYDLEVKYNDRSGVWTIDMAENVSGTVLFQGLPLVIGTDLLAPFNYGIGSLGVIDNSSSLVDATSEDLGSRIALLWISPDTVL